MSWTSTATYITRGSHATNKHTRQKLFWVKVVPLLSLLYHRWDSHTVFTSSRDICSVSFGSTRPSKSSSLDWSSRIAAVPPRNFVAIVAEIEGVLESFCEYCDEILLDVQWRALCMCAYWRAHASQVEKYIKDTCLEIPVRVHLTNIIKFTSIFPWLMYRYCMDFHDLNAVQYPYPSIL